MARTLSEIYNEAVSIKNKNLKVELPASDLQVLESEPAFNALKNVSNSSKMSVINAFIWIVAACIWTFESLLDVFQADLVLDLRNRINGTTAYYVNALYRYQHGDTLVMNDEGTQFSYATDDPSKRIISRVACEEMREARYFDRMTVFKVAKDNVNGGGFMPLDAEELAGARNYLKQISFAGTHCHLSSRKGDILIPRVTAYSDGTMTEAGIREGIRKALTGYINSLSFNATIYVNDILSVINGAPGIVNVDYDHDDPKSGIFVIQFDDDNQPVAGDYDKSMEGAYQDLAGNTVTAPATLARYEKRVNRVFATYSGFLREPNKEDASENGVADWDETIRIVDESVINNGLSADGYCYGKP